jgi:chromosome segregation ATPase
MDYVKYLLEEEKTGVFSALENLQGIAQNLLQQKNKKIHLLSSENDELREQLNKLREKFCRSQSSSGAIVKVLRIKWHNNYLRRALIAKEISLQQLKKNLMVVEEENKDKNLLNTREMTAFKVIALELEEKEKLANNYRVALETTEADKRNLLRENKELEKINFQWADNCENLKVKSHNLENTCSSQLNTIEAISRELQNKNEKVVELKHQFLDLVDSYNNLLQEIS